MTLLYKKLWLFTCTVLACGAMMAQQDWPRSISGTNGEQIKIYQPQVESWSGNTIVSRSAVSVIPEGKSDPVFGAFWWDASVADKGNAVLVQGIHISNIKFPDGVDNTAAAAIKSRLESEIPNMNISISKDELNNSLKSAREQAKLSSTFNNTPPKVIYTSRPSMLVLIDGEPKLQRNNTYNIDAVVNSPFTIVKNNDGRFYLYGGKGWYSASAATGPYSYVDAVPDNLKQIETAVKTNQQASAKNNADNNSDNDAQDLQSNTIPEIIVSTEPAELIQSNGEANFAPVENTGLLYVKNSSNDIFMDVNSQQYYVLLSGRWYKSSSLKGNWQYTAADKLPADFAKIPAGSPKDNVLASVAGTEQASDAIMDAAIPQTAKVDRRTASTTVTYDGDPEFENISGTRLQYALNASTTVLRYNGRYYAVDNGVWYISDRASGPWSVSPERPDDVDMIPPSYPVYNTKYVYVYDVTPDYIYTGYTPGYLNTYVYGPTIVYGTGYYYRPWWRHYYYARPYTWGFNMCYTPWYGWSFGYGFGGNWFDIGFGYNSWWGGGYRYGGWWGPSIYRPAYCGYYGYRSYGYYGYYRGFAYNNCVRYNYGYNNNIYYNRQNVYAYNNRSFVNNNRYDNGFRGRDRDGNRFNTYGGGRYNNGNRSGNNNNGFNGGNRPGFNNGNTGNNGNYNNNGGRRPGFNTDNGNASNGGGRYGRPYSPQGGTSDNNPRYNGGGRGPVNGSDGSSNGNFGRRPSFRTDGGAPQNNGGYSPSPRNYTPRSEGGGFNRNQGGGGFDRPGRSSAPSGGGGFNGGGRPSFNTGGGGSRPSGGGNFGGGGGGGGRSSGGSGGGSFGGRGHHG